MKHSTFCDIVNELSELESNKFVHMITILYRRIMWRRSELFKVFTCKQTVLFVEADVWVSVPLGAEFIHSSRWSEVRLTSSHRKLNLFTGPTAIWAQWPNSSSWLTYGSMRHVDWFRPTNSGTKSSPVSLPILWCGNFSTHTRTPAFTANVLTA